MAQCVYAWYIFYSLLFCSLFLCVCFFFTLSSVTNLFIPIRPCCGDVHLKGYHVHVCTCVCVLGYYCVLFCIALADQLVAADACSMKLSAEINISVAPPLLVVLIYFFYEYGRERMCVCVRD